MVLTKKLCFLRYLWWSSLLLIAPAAIAEEIQPTVSLSEVVPSSTTEQRLTSFNSNNRQVTTSASSLIPAEVTTSTVQSASLSIRGSAPDTTASTPSNSSVLDLAQVRPANGTSGPIVPSDPTVAAPAGNSEGPVASPTPAQPQAGTPANRWHFLFQPYVYTPLSISGDVTVRGFQADFDAGPSEIYSRLGETFKFGLASHVEGWTPDYHWGFLLNGEYLDLGKQNSFTRPYPDRFLNLALNRVANRLQTRIDDTLRQQIGDYLQGKLDGTTQAQLEARLGAKLATIVPSSFQSDVRVQTWNVDLAGAYRFYNAAQVNPKGVATEFDLGPYLIDIIAGIRIAGVSSDLDVTTNLGGEGDFSRSITTVKPLLGARFRYNFSPYLAGVIAGSVAGFDIGSLGLNWEVMGGLDWMFSGNTSVGLGYRFAYNGYHSDELEVNAYSNGPYLTFTFRF